MELEGGGSYTKWIICGSSVERVQMRWSRAVAIRWECRVGVGGLKKSKIRRRSGFNRMMGISDRSNWIVGKGINTIWLGGGRKFQMWQFPFILFVCKFLKVGYLYLISIPVFCRVFYGLKELPSNSKPNQSFCAAARCIVPYAIPIAIHMNGINLVE